MKYKILVNLEGNYGCYGCANEGFADGTGSCYYFVNARVKEGLPDCSMVANKDFVYVEDTEND